MGTFSFFWLPKEFYLGKKGKYGRFFRFVNTWWGNFQNKKVPEYSLFLESRVGIFSIYNQKIGKYVLCPQLCCVPNDLLYPQLCNYLK